MTQWRKIQLLYIEESFRSDTSTGPKSGLKGIYWLQPVILTHDHGDKCNQLCVESYSPSHVAAGGNKCVCLFFVKFKKSIFTVTWLGHFEKRWCNEPPKPVHIKARIRGREFPRKAKFLGWINKLHLVIGPQMAGDLVSVITQLVMFRNRRNTGWSDISIICTWIYVKELWNFERQCTFYKCNACASECNVHKNKQTKKTEAQLFFASTAHQRLQREGYYNTNCCKVLPQLTMRSDLCLFSPASVYTANV